MKGVSKLQFPLHFNPYNLRPFTIIWSIFNGKLNQMSELRNVNADHTKQSLWPLITAP